MIELSTGAVLDKELDVTDYTDGRRFGPKLGWLMAFNPCQICASNRTTCKRVTYKVCDKAYFELWKDKFLNGAQLRMENYGGSA